MGLALWDGDAEAILPHATTQHATIISPLLREKLPLVPNLVHKQLTITKHLRTHT